MCHHRHGRQTDEVVPESGGVGRRRTRRSRQVSHPLGALTWSTHYTGSVTTNEGVADLDFWTASEVPTTTVRGDWTGDGAVDLLGTNADGNLFVSEGNGNGTVRAAAQVGSSWSAFTWQGSPGDINGDRRTDLIARHFDGTLWFCPGRASGGVLAGKKVGSGWTGMASHPLSRFALTDIAMVQSQISSCEREGLAF